MTGLLATVDDRFGRLVAQQLAQRLEAGVDVQALTIPIERTVDHHRIGNAPTVEPDIDTGNEFSIAGALIEVLDDPVIDTE